MPPIRHHRSTHLGEGAGEHRVERIAAGFEHSQPASAASGCGATIIALNAGRMRFGSTSNIRGMVGGRSRTVAPRSGRG